MRWANFHILFHHNRTIIIISTTVTRKKTIVLKTLTLRWHMSHQDYQHKLNRVLWTSYTLQLSGSFEMYPKAPACNETYKINM